MLVYNNINGVKGVQLSKTHKANSLLEVEKKEMRKSNLSGNWALGLG